MTTTLDREQFKVTSEFLALLVPKRKIDSVVKNTQINKCLRRGRHLRYIVPVSQIKDNKENEKNDEHKLILFSSDFKTADDLPECVRETAASEGYRIVSALETQKYEDLTAGQVLTKLLPSDVVVPTAFETIGHIAHLNLLPSQQPWGKIIGQVLMDKNPGLRTVVNKMHNIEDEFRACPFELLAGEADYVAQLIENGYRLTINYEKVFWNSRLSRERERIAQQTVPRGSIVCDVMAGVGAFGIYLAAETNCEVYSNDLNREAQVCMETNIAANKCHGRIQTFNLDGRTFIRQMLGGKGDGDGADNRDGDGADNRDGDGADNRDGADNTSSFPSLLDSAVATPIEQGFPEAYRQAMLADKRRPKRARIEVPKWELRPERPIYFLMNLPAIAIEFLDAFKGSVASLPAAPREVHVLVYSFANPETAAETVKARVEGVLPGQEIVWTREVRDVSPKKSMFCTHIVIKPHSLLMA